MPLPNTDALLRGPRSKVKRAYSHIDSIRNVTEPLSKDWHTVEVERRIVPPHVNRYEFFLTYRPTQPIGEELALMIGDAVHNFRTALDYLAVGIVRTRDPAAKPYFPAAKNRKELPTHPHFPAMEQALPGATDLVLKQIRPENGPDEALWMFVNLDNDDKHNALIPVIALTSIDNINATIGTNRMINCGVGGNASKPINLIRSSSPITIENNFRTAVEITFGQGNPFENQSVISTLLQVGNLVTKTLNAFETLMRR